MKKHSLSKRSMITGMGVCLAFAAMSSVAAADVEDSNYDRTLQSVNIGLGNSGSIDSITDTRVSIGYGDEVEGETETTEYNPVEVVEDLPVRITPSYVTETSSGTDLSDLDRSNARYALFEVLRQGARYGPQLWRNSLQ